ncbi:M15 family metallopeptidase [Mycobacteroides franklinii]|uniref:M15 family metallopeptidase n=1 Tax=Mycobacteroides franklinii TaxID=948102 RepID=UPI000993388B|nr:M15 family metallopeptidase [Mycobacteroides franklinii]ORA64098.1 endolysin [Mycobacteroides franklinii]
MSFRTAYGNTTSENGWRMCNRDECDIVRISELYLVDTAPLRKGAPLTILGAWLYWYDRNVEEITSPVWGWSATNDVGDSNHLAGTAVDVMAPKYPWQQYTMDAATQAKVRKGLALFEDSVFWGRDWSRPDEMHYQMAWPEGDKRNDAFAAKLRAGYLGIYAPAQPAEKRFPQDLTDRELLEYIAAQLGPGDPAWASKGMTLRDKVWSK